MLTIEESKALGAKIYFFPEGKAVQAGGTCVSTAVPDANDPGWVDFIRVESWEGSRKDVKYEKVEDATTGSVVLADEQETNKGHMEYKFTVNVLLAFILGIFYRSAAELSAASTQFNPSVGTSPRGWLMLDHRDANGTVIIAANVWGRLKYDGPMKGGGGNLVKPELLFTEYNNTVNVMSLGS